jgi:hypothetical protein
LDLKEESFAYVDELVMIVTERKIREVAVEVKDHIAIDINEEVPSALLRIDKAAHLVGLV